MSILKNFNKEALVVLTAFTLAGLAPLAVSAAPQIRTKGGHGGGNGGDRLELTSGEGSGDVEISVPDDLDHDGTLEVVGTPGAGQKDQVYLSFCETDTQGHPIKFGCSESSKSIHLNEPTRLTPGTYFIVYSYSRAFVQVRPEEQTVVTLKKLKVTKVDRPITFAVFNDYTDLSMQDRYLKAAWYDPRNKDIVEIYCKRPSSAIMAVCAVWNSDNDQALKSVFQFDDKGNVYSTSLGTGRLSPLGIEFITDPEAGQFVSVFPGVYGVVFTDNQTGKTETRFGIHIN